MKHLFVSLFLCAAGLAAAMTPDEFTALYENPHKSKENCYKLYEAFSQGDGTEKDDAKAHKWLLEAVERGMRTARKELLNLPWRKTLSPSIPIAEVDDQTAIKLGNELSSLVSKYNEAQYRKKLSESQGTKLKETKYTKMTEKGLMREVRRLIKEGADLNCWYMMHGTPLSSACELNNLELIKLLVAHGADPCAYNGRAIVKCFYSDTYLDKCTYAMHEVYEKPDLSGIMGNERGGGGMTSWRGQERKERAESLKKATKKRDAECKIKEKILAFLLAHGAEAHLYNDDGNSLMYRAASCNSSLGIRMLAKAGVSASTPQDPREAVVQSHKEDSDFVKYRVAEKAHPLFGAIEWGNVSAVKALLKAGADTHARNQEGLSPLEFAERCLTDTAGQQVSDNLLLRRKDIISILKRASK